MPPKSAEQANNPQAGSDAASSQLGRGGQLSESTQNALRTEFLLSHQRQKFERSDPTVVDLVGEGAYNALYMTSQSPVKSLSQLADKALKTDGVIEKKFGNVLPAPVQEEFGTARWHAQQIGGGVGMILPFMAARGSLKLTGLTFAARTEAAAVTGSRLLSVSNAAVVADGALAGATYDFLFTPVGPGEGKFWEAKRDHALTGAATFGTLTAGSIALRTAGGEWAQGLRGYKKVLMDVGTGIGSGAPAGVVSADVNARLTKGRWATGEERMQGAYTMSVVGGVMSPFHRIPGQDISVGEKALENSSKRSGRSNLESMLAERARQASADARNMNSDQTTTRPLTGEGALVNARTKLGSAARALVGEQMREGRALASTDATETRQIQTNVPPELLPTLQRGAEMGLEASGDQANYQTITEFFKFAKSPEGAQVRDHMIQVAENYGDPRFITLVNEAYLPFEGVQSRVNPGDMSIKPDPGQKVTPELYERWQNFVRFALQPPADVEGYSRYRMQMFDWLNKNPDLHNWVRQLGEQTEWSNVAGPIDYYFGTDATTRFMDVHRGLARVEKPATMADIANMRKFAADFAEQVGTNPYDANLIENFRALAEKSSELNVAQLARHVNEALANARLLSICQVGVDSTSQMTLYRPSSGEKATTVGKVNYNEGGAVPADAKKFDVRAANEIANQFAHDLAGAKSVEEAQYILANSALNLKGINVPLADVPLELNWVLKNLKLPYEVKATEDGHLEAFYVVAQEGNRPLASVRFANDGTVTTRTDFGQQGDGN